MDERKLLKAMQEMIEGYARKDAITSAREHMAGEIGAVRDAMRDYVSYSITLGADPTPADYLAYTVNGLLRRLDDMGLIEKDD